MEFENGSACALEGPPEAFSRFLPRGAAPGHSSGRADFVPPNRQTGNRLRQQLVDSVTGEVVQAHQKGRGYQLGERQLLLVEDEELEAARQEARAWPFATA
jgi:hypothetical protein